MIDRSLAEQINEYWRRSRDTGKTTGARLEDMLAAADGAAIDGGSTVRKDSLVKYQALHLSFREWLNTPVTTQLPTGQFNNGVPVRVEVTFAETPAQLITQSPVKV